MKWTGINDLRTEFLTFFQSKGHTILDSAPLVPQDDEGLLLINSGMAPLKKFFTGMQQPPNKRLSTCQKCIRTPDIENVGKTARHGTYFEMLGNFSFGDYFKVEATTWAWEFITQVLNLPKDKLWVSIYLDDDEAFSIWTQQVGVDPAKIVRLGKADNFWEIGAGPCGPCSEIYFDRGEKYGCNSESCAVGCDCDRYIEFWNLVFTQFNSDGKGNYTPLEFPNIDTGMGLERIGCIMQEVDNLFEIDTVQAIMKHIMKIAGVTYKNDAKTDVSLRIITDHIRSTTFMVGDGVTPQNEGRGYVLRRLLRRAARHGRLLGITKPFLYQVAQTVANENATAYPELKENMEYISKVIKVEEERFSKTIDQGMDLLTILLEEVEKQPKEQHILSGEQVFKLYDTYGFPIDLTKEIAGERGILVDEEAFKKEMENQRKRARKARESLSAVGWEENVLSDIELKGEFVGYQNTKCMTKVVAILKDGVLVDSIGDGDLGTIVLEQTPFYAESGGQVGDSGTLTTPTSTFTVFDCKKTPSGHIVHIGELMTGTMAKADEVCANINEQRRKAITRNHTSAHLLQTALREVLGTHVHQSGSMVDENKCRFDFSHFSAMTQEEIAKTEQIVNQLILDANNVNVEEMSIAKAKELGAMALFGEKYGTQVRVCDVSGKSIELCGGTHVENTANIGLFKITNETSVAAGIRRIEATTGYGVLNLFAQNTQVLNTIASALKANNMVELPVKVTALSTELKEKEKEIEKLQTTLAKAMIDQLFVNAKKVGDYTLICTELQPTKPDEMRMIADIMKDKDSNMVGVLIAEFEGKTTIVTCVGSDAVKKGANAGKLIKEITAITGGSGGGRPDSAMGAVADKTKLAQAFEKLEAMLPQK